MEQSRYESHLPYGSRLLPFICRRDVISKTGKAMIRPHWHENLELLYCVRGHGQIIINGSPIEMHPGMTVVVNPNQIHLITSASMVEYHCIIIFDSFCRDNGIETAFVPVVTDAHVARLHQAMYESFSAGVSPVKLRLDALALLWALYENFSSPTLPEDRSVAKIKAAIDYIGRNYPDAITLDQAAEFSHFSKYHFTRKFREITGKTFSEFLNSLRCHKAAELLHAGSSAAEACFATGFHDPAYFSRVFRQVMGLPPSQYIRQQQKIHR